jgi:hypothetical protein
MEGNNTRAPHTNMDTYDHVLEDDLKQSAAVAGSLIYFSPCATKSSLESSWFRANRRLWADDGLHGSKLKPHNRPRWGTSSDYFETRPSEG